MKMMTLQSKAVKKTAISFICLFVFQLVSPTAAYALTGGPTQPEFSSFEPVATTNMVNEFTGDLTYNLPVLNIPGPDGGGYAMSLSYHSGTAVEQESSWVGYGWTLNPGSIVRNKRGFADDWNGEPVKLYNKTIPSRTVTLGGSLGDLEVYSIDLSFNGSASLRYNNYKGFGYTLGLGVSTTDGAFSLGFHLNDGESTFSAQVSPGALLNRKKNMQAKDESDSQLRDKRKALHAEGKKLDFSKKASSKKDRNDAAKKKNKSGHAGRVLNALGNSGYGMMSLANSPAPQLNTPFQGESFRLNVTFQLDPAPLEISPLSANLFGSYSSQRNEEVRQRNAYGYLYSENAWSDDASLMDYSVERPSGFNKHDKVLPVPYSSVDNYTLTGEGLGGGFRVHHSEVGEFTPEGAESTTIFVSGGVDLDAGLASGAGLDGSAGMQKLTLESWTDVPEKSFSSIEQNSSTESTFFRFTNDLAGNLGYGSENTWNTPSVASGDLTIDQNTELHGGGTNYIPRSSFVGANTNDQIRRNSSVVLNNPSNNNPDDQTLVYAYEKRKDVYDLAGTASAPADQYGEFSVVNESGSRYSYGLPVYSRKEETVSVTVDDNAQFDSKFLAFQGLGSDGDEIDIDAYQSVVGHYASSPYVSTYLLTSITTPDYIDRTQDGCTPDDFGGYTRFNYEKNDESDNWYRYRTPYEGLNYSKNSFSDANDDMGTYTAGEKEIYYLESVETKTHIAKFITSCRNDGVEAKNRWNAASGEGSISGLTTLKKLEKIVLFKKNADGSLGQKLQTTYFEYDYSTQEGGTLPNSGTCDDISGLADGKLTLKRVWTEYNDIFKAKISPYQFDYEYAHLNGLADYTGLGENGSYEAFMAHAAGTAQSAAYSPLISDAWGNYQNNPDRHNEYQRWLDQSNQARGNEDYDPAMWQLKRITLPSGGEIHIQYEQDEYAFVQHESAHALVSLTDLGDNDIRSATNSDDYYLLKASDVGITDEADLEKYVEQISDLYVGTGKKMYFKFFYKLLGFDTPNLEDCDSDFVSGYMDVKSVGIQIVEGQKHIKIVPEDENKLPRQLCRDFVRTQKAGNLESGSCNPTQEEGVFEGSDAVAFIENLINFAESFVPGNKCVKRDQDHSYLRIPIFRGIKTLPNGNNLIEGKRGGGLRVKRLLMYDNGLYSPEPVLYGTEYHYITKDYEGNYISSGVATNEPGPSREENPMVTFMERFKQSFVNRLVAGKDKKEMEGPIGENLLPGPSVGYSKVITSNIHTGKTHTGYIEKDFYTAYDCPFYYSENLEDPINPQWAINKGAHMATEIDKSGTSFPISIPAGLVNFSDHRVRARQGFNFALNNMHGQVKASTSFSNRFLLEYDDLLTSLVVIEDEAVMIAKEVHEYFGPGEKIPTVNQPFGAVEHIALGVEQDIAFESKHIKDKTTTVSVEGDGGLSIFGYVPLPFIAASPSFTSVNNEVYTHVTTKVTNYPAIEKKVSRYQDGIWHHTVNEKFDYYTGRPAVVRTYDDFVNTYEGGLILQGVAHVPFLTNHSFSAPMIYDEMGQKAEHEGRFYGTNYGGLGMEFTSDNTIVLGTDNPAQLCLAANTFIPGSLIQLSTGDDGATEQDIFHIDKFENGILHLLPVSFSDYTGITGPVGIKVIRSGKTNQLLASAGSVTTYGLPANSDIVPGVVELNAMNSLVNSLNNSSPVGSISGSAVASMTSAIDIMVDGECQNFPSNYDIDLTGGSLQITETANNTVPFTASCEEISPYVVDYLNQYWDAFLMPVQQFNLVNSECRGKTFKIGTEYWMFDEAQSTPLEVVGLANQIFSQSVYPELANTDCILDVIDRFEPIHRRPHPIPSELDHAGNRIYRNGEIIIHDILLDKYIVVMVECDFEENLLNLFYGVTDANGIGVTPKYTDYTQLERVAFDASHNVGEFLSSIEPCMLFEYPDDLTATLLTEPISDVSTDGMTCFQQVEEVTVICETDLPNNGEGEFALDNTTGDYHLVYHPYGVSCGSTSVLVSCLSFCEYSQSARRDVISSGFTVFDDNWGYDEQLYASNSTEASNFDLMNAFEKGQRGKWRPRSSYVYSEDRGVLSSFEDAEVKNYNSGVYDMLLFDWNNPDNYAKYKETSRVTKYSPNGSGLEEKNIIDIYSSAKFGYGHTVPYLVAQNADYASTFFESFENQYEDGFLEDGVMLDPETGSIISSDAHSGDKCLHVLPTNQGIQTLRIEEGSDYQDQGGLIKVWVKSDRVDRELIGQELRCNVIDEFGSTVDSFNFTEIARSGDWGLFETLIPSDQPSGSQLFVRYDFNYPNETLYLDDLRIQPLNSQVGAYVYDPNTLRLLASFDDQNFGLFYQYNEEGQLVRKLKETTRGMKTIQETQYNIPKID